MAVPALIPLLAVGAAVLWWVAQQATKETQAPIRDWDEGIVYTSGDITRSATADRLGVTNFPPPMALVAADSLGRNVLVPLSELLGGKIPVTSWYRSEVVNTAVGGSDESQHIRGEAADISPSAVGVSRLDFPAKLRASGVVFDQCIVYQAGVPGAPEVHISLTSRRTNRRQVLYRHKGITKLQGQPW